MALSVFDLFKIGIGPSSSHTVGPMRAANEFITGIEEAGQMERVFSIKVELFGSLGATGKVHGSDTAVLLGLEGEWPESVDTDEVTHRLAKIRGERALRLVGKHLIAFDEPAHLIMHKRRSLPAHPNGMRFKALDERCAIIRESVFYSVGGGFIVDETAMGVDRIAEDRTAVAYPFTSAAELLALCNEHGLSVSSLLRANERAWRDDAGIDGQLLNLWAVMKACVARGCVREGLLPGGMQVRRRAATLYRKLKALGPGAASDPLVIMDWVNLFALAVNEENAAGGRVVTAPTNGAAGIIPAVLHYYTRFCPGADDDGVTRFLLAAGGIGMLYKLNASISGAEVGCQGEVGSACSMAAAGLAEVLGGTPAQVENAAEVAMEHNLGLTCDPVGGLVQVPCIERNAIASVKAINAARLALNGDGRHFVSLDKVIKTMRDTGADMKTKYKETARGGLALNVIEVPLSLPQC
ncbi:MAG: L-serine ammonia-lyase [Gammaproteobacteria bacterium]|nr:L-serine ammonia-lyase [Gammaproteobacteria bacterium]